MVVRARFELAKSMTPGLQPGRVGRLHTSPWPTPEGAGFDGGWRPRLQP